MITALASPPCSYATAQVGHVQRGEIVQDGWNAGLFIGLRNGQPMILWGLFNPSNERFADACQRFDDPHSKQRLHGPTRGSQSGLPFTPRKKAG